MASGRIAYRLQTPEREKGTFDLRVDLLILMSASEGQKHPQRVCYEEPRFNPVAFQLVKSRQLVIAHR
jgi:hypothetical protein